MRGRGIGRKISEWTISKARDLGYRQLKLYTSTDPNETMAQKLYESVGLKLYKREPSEDVLGEEIWYRVMDL
jgi:GNAT superfamily N-acetyltransferase